MSTSGTYVLYIHKCVCACACACVCAFQLPIYINTSDVCINIFLDSRAIKRLISPVLHIYIFPVRTAQ